LEVEEHEMEADLAESAQEKADFIARQFASEEADWNDFCKDLTDGDYC
jgi:hypothetical protein